MEESTSQQPILASQDPAKSKNTVLGVEENVEAALCYVLVWLTGLLFLLIEKENKIVRFHAMQSLATFLPLQLMLFVPVINFLSIFLVPLYFILWIFLIFKAYRGEYYKLLIVGNFAEKQINK